MATLTTPTGGTVRTATKCRYVMVVQREGHPYVERRSNNLLTLRTVVRRFHNRTGFRHEVHVFDTTTGGIV